jgi:hypothetical protein
MNTRIDIKSALIGLLLGIMATVAIGASSPRMVGRYQLTGVGNHGLIIDTTSGKIWSGYFPPNSGQLTDKMFFEAKEW